MKVPVYKRQVDMTMETGSRDLTASLNPNAMAAPAIALAGVGKQIMSIAGQKFQHDQAEKKVKNENDVNNALLTGIEQTKQFELQAIEEVKSDPVKAEINFEQNLKKILPPLLSTIKDKNAQDKLRFKLGKFLLETQSNFQIKNVQTKTDFVVQRNEQLNKSFTTGIMNKNLDYDIRLNSLKEVVDNYKKLTADGFQTLAEEQQRINAFKQNTMLEMSVELSRSYKNPQLMLTQLLNQKVRDDVVFETEDGEQDELLNEMIASLDPGEERSVFLSALNKKLKDIINIRDDENKRQEDDLKKKRFQLEDVVFNDSLPKEERLSALRTLEEGYSGFSPTDISNSEFEIMYKELGVGGQGEVSFAEQDDDSIRKELDEKASAGLLGTAELYSKKRFLKETSFEKLRTLTLASFEKTDQDLLGLAKDTIGFVAGSAADGDVIFEAQKNTFTNVAEKYKRFLLNWPNDTHDSTIKIRNPNKDITISKSDKLRVINDLINEEYKALNVIYKDEIYNQVTNKLPLLNKSSPLILQYITSTYPINEINKDNAFDTIKKIREDFQNFLTIPDLTKASESRTTFQAARRFVDALFLQVSNIDRKIR
jgi:hypothetical protein